MNNRLQTVTILLVLGLLSCIAARSALADSVSVTTTGSLPSYTVIGNGSDYTGTTGAIGGITFKLEADAGATGKVKSWSTEGNAVAYDPDSNAIATFHDYGPLGQSFDWGFRPKSITRDWTYTPEAAELVDACNALADGMRGKGYSNTYIFNRDNTVKISFIFKVDVDFTLTVFKDPPVVKSVDTELTCKKWAGKSAAVNTAGSVAATQGVSAATLALQEQYGPAGFCMVKLSGTIETNFPNVKVGFRYVHHDDKKSAVHEVTTGANKKAVFNHQYKIPNQPGPEGGSIKAVGVSHPFETNSVAYSMNCTDPGPQALKPNPGPIGGARDLAQAFAVSAASIKLDKQHYSGVCPMNAQAVLSIGANAAGNVVFQLNHNGSKGPQQQVVFNKAGVRDIHLALGLSALGDPGPDLPNAGQLITQQQAAGGPQLAVTGDKPWGYVRVEILSPKSGIQKSNDAVYTVNCTTPVTGPGQIGVQPPGSGFKPALPGALKKAPPPPTGAGGIQPAPGEVTIKAPATPQPRSGDRDTRTDRRIEGRP